MDSMKFYLVNAISCVEPGDASVGATTGVGRQQILWALRPTYSASVTSPLRQRIYIASIEGDQSQVNAAYDIVYDSGPSSQSDAVSHFEPVCGIPSSLSMFDGWTGKIGTYGMPLGDWEASYAVLLIGSSASEQTPRFLFYLNHCSLGICGPPNLQ
jgi:hypothetical protein